ncbi:TPA: tail fiber protein, partial [Salmonella enterica]
MGKLTEITQWEEDIYQLETSDPVVGGPDGVSNKPQKQLANRTQWLKQQLESTNNALAEHAKSRNHPDASLTAKGFVQLYSGVMSDSEILAATPKAVKAAMDNANSRQPGNENLTALSSLAGQPDRLPYFTNKGAMTLAEFTAFMRTMLSKTDAASVLQYLGLKETVDQAAGALQKSQNGADIPDTALFRQSIGVYDASTSQKGLVRLNGGVSDADDTLGATSGAVKIAYDAAQSAYRLALSKYTADGATTGKAGLVQLVNSMGGSGSLVMPQAAVTTAIQNYPSLGKGQTLQDLRGSRSIDATYTNLTGFPIAVYVRISGGYSAVLYTYV